MTLHDLFGVGLVLWACGSLLSPRVACQRVVPESKHGPRSVPSGSTNFLMPENVAATGREGVAGHHGPVGRCVAVDKQS